MRLLIVSHTPHYRCGDSVVGWGPTVREISRLATRFERVRHVACLHPEEAPKSALPYTSTNVTLVPVSPAGGETLAAKLSVFRAVPEYARVIARELATADMVHVRAPANIAMVAMAVLSTRRRPERRWFKYAGNWQPDGVDNPSYRAQRWWLRHSGAQGIVTVNGAWPGQPPWIRAFDNPSLEAVDLERGAKIAANKRFALPLRLLYVGQLTISKGAGRAIEVLALLRDRNIPATLQIVGDGEERASFEALVAKMDLATLVEFTGWKPATELHTAYAAAHVLLFPSASEGWPKVISEGMAYGVVPVASAVSSIPQYLARFDIGAAIPADRIGELADAVEHYARDPKKWARESARAAACAERFSFDSYLKSVDDLVSELSRG